MAEKFASGQMPFSGIDARSWWPRRAAIFLVRLGSFRREKLRSPQKRVALKEDISNVALMPKAFIATASPTAGACLKPCPEQADTT